MYPANLNRRPARRYRINYVIVAVGAAVVVAHYVHMIFKLL